MRRSYDEMSTLDPITAVSVSCREEAYTASVILKVENHTWLDGTLRPRGFELLKDETGSSKRNTTKKKKNHTSRKLDYEVRKSHKYSFT